LAGIKAKPLFAEIKPKGKPKTGKTSTSFPARLSVFDDLKAVLIFVDRLLVVKQN
jgi:hypothetical protein